MIAMTKDSELQLPDQPVSPGTKRRFNPLEFFNHRFHMAPRKKSKPNPKAPAADNAVEADGKPPEPSKSIHALEDRPTSTPVIPKGEESVDSSTHAAAPSPTPTDAQPQQHPDKKANRKTWYGGGSWRAKASPVAQVAKEGATVVGNIVSSSLSDVSKVASKSPASLLSKSPLSKGDPCAASMTKVNVTTGSSNGSQTNVHTVEPDQKEAPVPEPPLPPDPAKDDVGGSIEKTNQNDGKKQTPASSGWRIWWSRPDGYATDDTRNVIADKMLEDAKGVPLPGVTPVEDFSPQQKALSNAKEDSKEANQSGNIENEATTVTTTTDKAAPGRSWFGLWSSAQNARNTDAHESTKAEEVPSPKPDQSLVPDSMATPPASDVVNNNSDTLPQQQPKSSGWAFWSRETPKNKQDEKEGTAHKEVGELAVADTPSQSKPEAAQYNEVEDVPLKESTKSVRGKSRGKEVPSKSSTPVKPTPLEAAPKKPKTMEVTPVKSTAKVQQRPNLVLPQFSNTYFPLQAPSYWKQFRSYLVGSETAAPHVHIAQSPPRIKKALAIGVHGYFPAALIQMVIGQPTGTSIRFANAAAAAINEWTEERGYSCDIEKVALEGEGFIADRVSTLWKLLLNWIDHIKTADFILVACHSQGVPVAVMLVSKLIAFGCVSAARIGICAMAGVNQGPFLEYKSRFFGGSAAELFEFSQPKSTVSQMYFGALEEALKYGVRIVYVGSMDDQLVPLESSTFSNISHPYLYRAVFVDGRFHVPDFITHLISFTLKLRNLGLSDHGLIRELSPALAGSLYGGEGHSRLYEEPSVYKLAVQHALETTSLPQAMSQDEALKLKIREYDNATTTGPNPYFLPWAMRGILDEEFVKKELRNEVEELLAHFEVWKPTAKALKDVRFRLEAVRSKL